MPVETTFRFRRIAMSSKNINTREYWEGRFSSNDWENAKGRTQTKDFAEALAPHLGLDETFQGTLLDFGCGLGDALPVYRRHFPRAKLLGMDISEHAVRKCWQRYGDIAEFMQGEAKQAPAADVIVTSNVLEHLDNDIGTAQRLMTKCQRLFVVVPYREWPLDEEHVRSYDDSSFAELKPVGHVVFPSRSWSQFGLRLWRKVYLKNVLRKYSGLPLHRRRLQIMYKFKSDSDAAFDQI